MNSEQTAFIKCVLVLVAAGIVAGLCVFVIKTVSSHQSKPQAEQTSVPTNCTKIDGHTVCSFEIPVNSSCKEATYASPMTCVFIPEQAQAGGKR